MATDRSIPARPARRWSETARPPAERRDRADRIVRWIGAAKRRAARLTGEDRSERTIAAVISLTWIDTFGRPACRRSAETSPTPGAVIPLWPSRP